jgi:Lipoprotein LpqB beta-propeller domain/Sporulation and spore germination
MNARRSWGALAVFAATVALAGCVSLPNGGPADSGTGGGGTTQGPNPAPNTDLSQGGIIVNPVPPGAQWQPKDIVRGFLAASGSNRDVARQYLTPMFAKRWKPGQAATVIDTVPAVNGAVISPHVTGGPTSAQMTVTSQTMETLTTTGKDDAFRLQTATAPGPYQFHFVLSEIGGKWRINGILGLSKRQEGRLLLISNADFVRDYQPRNLYFAINSVSHTLVPYPVFIPDRPFPGGLTKLVKALTTQPPSSNWLYRAVTTGFPAGTKVAPVQIRGNEAIVTLSGAASNTDFEALQQMEAQLVTTLTSSPYSSNTSDTGIGYVLLKIKNTTTQLFPAQFKYWLPSSPGALFFQSANQTGEPQFYSVKASAVGVSRKDAVAARSPVVLPAGLGSGPLNAIAVSPQNGLPSTFAGCRGKEVYVVPLFGNEPLVQPLPSACSSLSWDGMGRLWVAAGNDVFVLTELPTSKTGLLVSPVTIPAAQITSADTFTSLKVAPDGVRVALIVHNNSGSMVYVTATTVGKRTTPVIYLGQSGQLQPVGPDLDDPVALAWWGPDHLLVLDDRDGTNQLYEVPLNGGQSTRVPSPPNLVSVAGNGSVAVVGTKTTVNHSTQEVIESAGNLDGIWHRVAAGSVPAYPG